MICTKFTNNIDRFTFDQSVSIIDAMLDEMPEAKSLKEAFNLLKIDFENLYDAAYEQAEILNNIYMELE